MEDMVGMTVVQTRLSLGKLHKDSAEGGGYMENGKMQGGAIVQLYLTWA